MIGKLLRAANDAVSIIFDEPAMYNRVPSADKAMPPDAIPTLTSAACSSVCVWMIATLPDDGTDAYM